MTKASIAAAHYQVQITNGTHAFIADEPADMGGEDTGPAPDSILEASLASCTAITLRMYADRKNWKVTGITVLVSLERADSKTIFTREIAISGEIDETQRERMLQIAKSCPVSKSLLGEIEINSHIA
ncbi:MAG: OsmC family protein [Bacteroidota bacterium]|nr:OsmC family protein [Bacteroidota bacterium]